MTAAPGETTGETTGETGAARAAGPWWRRPAWSALHRWLHAAAGAILIIAAWYLVSQTAFQHTRAVPVPGSVLAQMLSDLGSSTAWGAIGATCWEALQGYLLGNAVALILAALVLLVPLLEGVTTEIAVIVACVPLTAIAPLIVLMSPTSSRACAVVLGAMGVFYTTVIGSLAGLRAADPVSLDLVRAYGGGRLAQLRKVRVMAALPSVLAALRIAAPAAFVGAILGEFFLTGVNTGLGIMIEAAQARDTPGPLWALALLSAAVAGAGYAAVSLLARLVLPWVTGGAPGEA